jgi:hypothetical protein
LWATAETAAATRRAAITARCGAAAKTWRRTTAERRSIAAIEHHRAALLWRRLCTADAGLIQALRHDVDRTLVDEADDERAALDDVAVTDRLLLDPRVVEVRTVRAP